MLWYLISVFTVLIVCFFTHKTAYAMRISDWSSDVCSSDLAEVISKIRHNEQREAQVVLLRDLCDTMLAGSLCALGGMTPYPVLSALEHFPEDFGLPTQHAANTHSA